MTAYIVNAQKLLLTGELMGTYTGSEICITEASIDSAEFVICVDKYTPSIVLWHDLFISDDEWITDGWDAVIQDSADFFSQSFLDFMQTLKIEARDDCMIDTFGVYDVIITPPGDITRPLGDTREFNVFFRAVDGTGKMVEEDMIFRRTFERY